VQTGRTAVSITVDDLQFDLISSPAVTVAAAGDSVAENQLRERTAVERR